MRCPGTDGYGWTFDEDRTETDDDGNGTWNLHDAHTTKEIELGTEKRKHTEKMELDTNNA